jgi:hypothetical protein
MPPCSFLGKFVDLPNVQPVILEELLLVSPVALCFSSLVRPLKASLAIGRLVALRFRQRNQFLYSLLRDDGEVFVHMPWLFRDWYSNRIQILVLTRRPLKAFNMHICVLQTATVTMGRFLDTNISGNR